LSLCPNAEYEPSGAAVGQLALVAGQHQRLGLRHDLRLVLPGLAQVARDEDIRREEEHILLAAAVGHLQEAVQPLDRLAQEAAGHRDDRARRARDRAVRRGEFQAFRRAGGEDQVLDLLAPDPPPARRSVP
jgi:hypothetical protein